MNKKIKYQIIAGIFGALIIGVFGFGYFTGYGGNNCDQPPQSTCDCFCCHYFGLRGYESCGMFGLYSGILLGALIGISLVYFIWKIKLFQKK